MIKVRFNNVSKTYKYGEEKIKELSNFNLEIKNGEIVVLCGSYGTFKTTLLNFLVKIEVLKMHFLLFHFLYLLL